MSLFFILFLKFFNLEINNYIKIKKQPPIEENTY